LGTQPSENKAMFEEKNRPKKGSGFVWSWVLSVLSFSLFFAAHLFNAYRTEWFNVDHRSAAHNFAFNIGTFIPLHLASALLCIICLVCFIIAYKSAMRNKLQVSWADKLALAPLIPVALTLALMAAWIGIIIVGSYIHPS
jgi:hypothetical protein